MLQHRRICIRRTAFEELKNVFNIIHIERNVRHQDPALTVFGAPLFVCYSHKRSYNLTYLIG